MAPETADSMMKTDRAAIEVAPMTCNRDERESLSGASHLHELLFIAQGLLTLYGFNETLPPRPLCPHTHPRAHTHLSIQQRGGDEETKGGCRENVP